MDIKLSVCIPTYNFGKFISETLKSIISQATDEVEIIVVDGASSDDTTKIIKKLQEVFPRLTYRREDLKGGIDIDLAKTISLAKGKYCWLFSADDVMNQNSIATVLKEIDEGFDVYLCGFTLCTYELTPITEHKILSKNMPLVFDLANPVNRLHYFRKSKTTTEFFSYCSSLIVKKEKWDSIHENGDFIGSCWDHAARIFGMIPQGLRVKHIPEPLLCNRGGNDSFSSNGIVNRMKISVDGYHKIGEYFFGKNSEESYHIRRCVRAEWPLERVMDIKNNCIEKFNYQDLLQLNEIAIKNFSDPQVSNRIALFIYNFINPKSYLLVQSIYSKGKSLIKSSYKTLYN